MKNIDSVCICSVNREDGNFRILRNVATVLLFILAFLSSATVYAEKQLKQSTGTVNYLRVHNVGSGWGPASDFLDVEIIVKLSTQPGKAFGVKLRSDTNGLAHQGMLDLLRDAFDRNWTVTIDYFIEQGKSNGEIVLVTLRK